MAEDSFPRQRARTRGFTLGAPRSFRVAEDGSRVAFIRSKAGDDPEGCLWVLDVATGEERLVVDPSAAGDSGKELTQDELDRRERMREQMTGVTTYDVDPGLTFATFVVGGQVHVADLVAGGARPLEGAAEGAFDARPDPTGRRLAYVVDGALHVQDLDGGSGRVLVSDDDPDIQWGVAEFAAAEELERHRGYWWSPDGERIAVARVDERPVLVWHIASPVDPDAPPRAVRYPQVGTDNADVTLSVLGLDGSRVDVDWDREAFPYLVHVTWSDRCPLTLLVLSRDQKRWAVLEADADSGKTQTLVDRTAEHWQTIVTGVPDRLADGRLVFVEETGGHPPDHGGRRAGHAARAPGRDDPRRRRRHPVRGAGRPHGAPRLARAARTAAPERLTAEPGVHVAARGGDGHRDRLGARWTDASATVRVLRGGDAGRGDPLAGRIAGDRGPARRSASSETGHPRGGVHARRCRARRSAPGARRSVRRSALRSGGQGAPGHARAQWLADQGFAVLVADGRGTPGRGIAWEHAVYRDFAGPVLEDQVDALHAAADRFGFLDLDEVGIRGWSFGGYLAALAVLRRPDVFHAAVAGAPVTDQRLYDTAYTERYLGLPQEEPEAYRRNSLIGTRRTSRGRCC